MFLSQVVLAYVIVLIKANKMLLNNNAYGYFEKVGIPEAKRMFKAEEERKLKPFSRIVNGEQAELGQFIYQAGLLVSLLDIDGIGVCGGSLVNSERIITAAHCWYDGVHQGYNMTVVLGSKNLFFGGTRVITNVVIIHQKWYPSMATNDVAIVFLPNPVKFTDNIGPISLPYGRDICQTFVGYTAVVTGYGAVTDDTSAPTNQNLNNLNVTVISNDECAEYFSGIIKFSNICIKAAAAANVCRGDSGGPLATTGIEGKLILIGVTSFGSLKGCESNSPSGFSRVTSYMEFFKKYM